MIEGNMQAVVCVEHNRHIIIFCVFGFIFLVCRVCLVNGFILINFKCFSFYNKNKYAWCCSGGVM